MSRWNSQRTREVSYRMIFIEPVEAYEFRTSSSSRQKADVRSHGGQQRTRVELKGGFEAPLAYEDGWDEVILMHLLGRRGESVKIVSLASELRRCVRHRNKAHKEELKRHILKRVGILIKRRLIVRVRRCFVTALRG